MENKYDNAQLRNAKERIKMENVNYEAQPGQSITDACEKAVELAKQYQPGVTVKFEFNGIKVTATRDDDPANLVTKWHTDYQAAADAWHNSDEYKEQERKREEELKKAMAAHMVEEANTEASMRDAKVPTPLTKEQLAEYIESLVSREHDYGTCVYAMSMAATAAFNYVASRLGSTGFQASCADMDVLRRTRMIKGPFMLINGENALYPQYDLPTKLAEAMEKWKPWLKEQAEKHLAESGHAHPEVIAHWKKLAKSA